MWPVVFIFSFFVLSRTNSQIVPIRFDQAMQRLSQYERFAPEVSMREQLQYNLTPEKISTYLSATILTNKTDV